MGQLLQIIAALLLLAGCAIDPAVIVKDNHKHYVSPSIPKGCVLQGGVAEPTYPPYVWIQPPGDTLWYPGGQCKSDEELGSHGH